MRKILIPTDFSNNAMNAINYTCELFKYEVTEIFLMHAFQDDIYTDRALLTRETLNEVTKIIEHKSLEQLDKILNEIQEVTDNPKHSFKLIAANAQLIDEADRIVDDENIDIIIMGTRGATDDRKLTFGSNTLQILKYVQCPVLAVPVNFKYTPPKHILFPTNYMIPYKRRELKLLCEIASPFRAQIDMLHVSNISKLSLRQEDNREFIKDELCKNKIDFKTIKDKNVVNAINQYINEHPIDILVMVNTRHSFLENILYKSTIDKVSLSLDIPFLAMQNIRRS